MCECDTCAGTVDEERQAGDKVHQHNEGGWVGGSWEGGQRRKRHHLKTSSETSKPPKLRFWATQAPPFLRIHVLTPSRPRWPHPRSPLQQLPYRLTYRYVLAPFPTPPTPPTHTVSLIGIVLQYYCNTIRSY